MFMNDNEQIATFYAKFERPDDVSFIDMFSEINDSVRSAIIDVFRRYGVTQFECSFIDHEVLEFLENNIQVE